VKVRVIRRNRLACQSGNVLRLRGLCETTGRWLKTEKDRPVRARYWRVRGPERLLRRAMQDQSAFDSSHGAWSTWPDAQPSWIKYDFGAGNDREIVPIFR
jgi:hypothetical protein